MPLLFTPLSFLFLYSFLSSFYPPHLLFVSFLQPHLLALPLPSLRIHSFFPTRFFRFFFSSLAFFPYGSRHIVQFRYIVRERNNKFRYAMGQLPADSLGEKIWGRKERGKDFCD